MTVLIIDHDNLGADEARMELEAANYPNDCIYPHVLDCITKDIGDWDDDHPLNQRETNCLTYLRNLPNE